MLCLLKMMIFKKNYGYVKLPEGKTHIKSYIPVQSCNMLQTLEVANQVDGFQAFIPGFTYKISSLSDRILALPMILPCFNKFNMDAALVRRVTF